MYDDTWETSSGAHKRGCEEVAVDHILYINMVTDQPSRSKEWFKLANTLDNSGMDRGKGGGPIYMAAERCKVF